MILTLADVILKRRNVAHKFLLNIVNKIKSKAVKLNKIELKFEQISYQTADLNVRKTVIMISFT